jgi:hypothetical protein
MEHSSFERAPTGHLMSAFQSGELHQYKQPDLFSSYAQRHSIVIQENEYQEVDIKEAEVRTVYEALKKEKDNQEALEKKGEESVKATIASWGANRARLDVEMQRKIESSMYMHSNIQDGTIRQLTPDSAEYILLTSPYSSLPACKEYDRNIIPRDIVFPGYFDLSMARVVRLLSLLVIITTEVGAHCKQQTKPCMYWH